MEIFIFTTFVFLSTTVGLIIARLRREQEITADLESILARLENISVAMEQSHSTEVIDQVIAEHLDRDVQESEDQS